MKHAPTAGRAVVPSQRSDDDTAGGDATGVYLPVSLVERLRKFAKSTAGTYTDITLDAIEDVHDRLADLVRPAVVAGPSRSGPLFAGRQPRRMTHTEPHQQVNMRFSAQDLEVIDQLVEQVDAPNRSAMLSAALDAYLPDGKARAQR